MVNLIGSKGKKEETVPEFKQESSKSSNESTMKDSDDIPDLTLTEFQMYSEWYKREKEKIDDKKLREIKRIKNVSDFYDHTRRIEDEAFTKSDQEQFGKKEEAKPK